MSLERHSEVCACNRGVCSLYNVLVTKTARKGTLLGNANEAKEKFGPLKVVLGTIPAVYANREVRSKPPSHNSPLTSEFQQGSVAVGNKIEVLLSHIVTLEQFFDSRPGDVAEQRRRDELIRYILVFFFF